MLDVNNTVFEEVDQVAVGDIRTRLKNILGSFLFQGEDMDKKVKVLSGGEKSRLALAKLLLTPGNFLILDEPTNHLDMVSKDILKTALLEYTGSIIIVSHDRDFLQGLTSKVYEFKNHTIKEHIGDISEYLRKHKLETLKELERNEKIRNTQAEEPVSENKLRYEQRKDLERQARKLKNQIAVVEEEIDSLEQALKGVNTKLSNPEEYSEEIRSGSLYQEHGKLEGKLEEAMNQWEILHGRLEKLQG
jgi:ATP-binding cassette subfamily F protein 3